MKPAYRLGVSLLYVEMLPQSFLNIVLIKYTKRNGNGYIGYITAIKTNGNSL